jgi:hypothetical protein
MNNEPAIYHHNDRKCRLNSKIVKEIKSKKYDLVSYTDENLGGSIYNNITNRRVGCFRFEQVDGIKNIYLYMT